MFFIFSLFLSLSTSLSLFFILELIFLSYLSTLISFLSHRSLMDLFLFSKSVFKKSFFCVNFLGHFMPEIIFVAYLSLCFFFVVVECNFLD